MPIDDLWYLRRNGLESGQRRRSSRYGKGKRWRVRWIDPSTGEPRTQRFERKADAELHDANVHADISQGRYIDPQAGRVTVAEHAAQWRAAQLHRDSTADLAERACRLHIIPHLGRREIADVRSSDIQSWIKNVSQDLAPSTTHLVYSYLKAMFGAAVSDRIIRTSPCTGVRLPPIDRRERYIPSSDQIHALSERITARYSPIPYLAAGCGLRGGEIFGLELEHVDLDRREIHVLQQLKRMAGTPPYIGEPKTRTSYRTVEMPNVVCEALSAHLERFDPVRLELEDRTNPRRPRHRATTLLFATSNGLPLHRSNWSRVWRTAIGRTDIPAGFGLHGLRHYFATLLIHNGASVKTVQLALGHSSPTITLNTYAHEWPDALDRTRSLVDEALKRGRPDQHS